MFSELFVSALDVFFFVNHKSIWEIIFIKNHIGLHGTKFVDMHLFFLNLAARKTLVLIGERKIKENNQSKKKSIAYTGSFGAIAFN